MASGRGRGARYCAQWHLAICGGTPGSAFVPRTKALDNRDRPTRASAAVRGDRRGDRPTINAGARLQEKYAALRTRACRTQSCLVSRLLVAQSHHRIYARRLQRRDPASQHGGAGQPGGHAGQRHRHTFQDEMAFTMAWPWAGPNSKSNGYWGPKATPLSVRPKSTVCTVPFCVFTTTTDVLFERATQTWLPSGVTDTVLAAPVPRLPALRSALVAARVPSVPMPRHRQLLPAPAESAPAPIPRWPVREATCSGTLPSPSVARSHPPEPRPEGFAPSISG